MVIGVSRISTTALLLISSCCAGLAQERRDKHPSEKARNEPIAERSFKIESLANEAKAVAPEFGVDVMLRIVKSNRVTDLQWKREILEDAFHTAADLQNPLRQRAIPLPAGSADTRPKYRTNAFDLRLDALSVKSRIVIEMLAIDKGRAVEMVNTISPKLPFKAITCSDAMVYDVSEFYQTLGKVSKTAFTEKQIDQGERLQFLMPYVQSMSSPAQIAPIAELIVSLQLPLKEFLPASDAFVAALKKISADDRSFSDALLRGGTLRGVVELFDSLRRQKLPYKELLGALRRYLLKHLQNDRCQDTFIDAGKGLPSFITDVNSLFPDEPLTVDDIRPARLEPGPKMVSYYESVESAKLLSEFKSLRSDEKDQPISEAQMATAEWQQRMLEFLTELEAWSGTNEDSEMDYFNQKCVFYFSLAGIAPTGLLREKVIRSYIKILSQSELQKQDRIEWLLYANQLFQRVRSAERDEGANVVEILSYSQNPVMRLYAGLMRERLFSKS